MKQTIEIEVPDGKQAIWKDNKVVFKDINPKLPKTWEEFCKTYKSTYVLSSKYAAKQHLALMQLHQLRDCYRQGWEPDWDDNSIKSGIKWNHSSPIKNTELEVVSRIYQPLFLSFPTYDLANEFLTNFRELIEEAGDLI